MCQVKDDKNKKQTDTSGSKKNKSNHSNKPSNIPTSSFSMPSMAPSMNPLLNSGMNQNMQSMNPCFNPAMNPSINPAMNPGMSPVMNPGMSPVMNPGISPVMMGSKNMSFNRNCTIMGNGVNSITERMDRLKLGPQPVPVDQTKKFIPSSTMPAELTTRTAIQINQAVNQLSSRPTFPNNFDLENIKLPPGITITKVDPANVHRKLIQVLENLHQEPVLRILILLMIQIFFLG